MEIDARVRELTAGFLDAQGERIVETLSASLGQAGTSDRLPAHRALFDLARAHVRRPSPRAVVTGVRRALAEVPRHDIQPLLSGQIALWTTLHRMLREVDGPHGAMGVIHTALALAGDTVDGVLGALIDRSQGGGPAPGWGTLVEAGRTHRECHALNRLARDLLDACDPAHTFEVLERGILDTFHLRSLVIVAVDHEEGFVEMVRGYSEFPRTRGPLDLRLDLSHPDILCDVARTGRIEVIDGWDPRYHEWLVRADGGLGSRQRPRDFNAGQTAFFVPILARDRAIGLIATGSTQEGKPLVLREIERMQPFLHQVGATLSNVSEIAERRRAEEALRKGEAELRQLARRQEGLLRISRAVQEMVRPSDLGRVMQVCLEEVKEIGLDAQSMAIHRMIDPARRIVETFRVGPEGPISAFQRRKSTAVTRCWQNGQIVYNEDHEKTPKEAELLRNRFGGLPIRSHVNVPFSRGVISAHSVRPRAFSGSDMEVLKQVAEIFSVGFSRMEDLERVEASRKALQESEATNRALLEAIPDLIIRHSRDGVYLDFKAAKDFETLVPPGEFLGKRADEVLPAEVARKAMRHIEQAIQAGDVQIFEYQLPVRGEMRDYEARVVVCGEEEVLGIVRDITERKRMEEALRESEKRYRTLFDLAGDAFLTVLPQGDILDANQAAAKILGYSKEEIIRLSGSQIIAPEVMGETEREWKAQFEKKRVFLLETMWVRKDGSHVPVEVSGRPFELKGQVLFHLIGRDITERKQLEAQLRQAQKMEAVGRLAGGIAHDFNNLLQVIMGFSEFLLTRLAPGDPSRREVEEIYKAGERAASLTRQLLAFGRRQVLRPKALDLNALVSNMGRMLRRLISEDVDLVTVLRPGLGRVKADPGQIEQVIVNLAVNARDAMPEGGKLTVETENVYLDEAYVREHPDASPGLHVRLTVSDTGCGIDPEIRPHLFEPFFTTKEAGKGTGLGLATVYGIVTQSRGHITVASEPGRGSTFSLYLPRAEEPAEAAPSAGGMVELPGGSETLLLVEDDELVRNLVGMILRKCGYAVIEASDGLEALRVSGGHPGPIHLMVADVVMPRMNGQELAQRLTPLRPEMKVLYISGYADDADVRQDALEGDIHLLQKPFTPEVLARRVREVMDGFSKEGA